MILRMERRIFFKFADASSAISSSERMHRRISFKSGVSGSIFANSSSRESVFASSRSLRAYAFARLATSSNEAVRSNSSILIVPPISRRFKEAPILCVPENVREPFWKILVSASLVCCCAIRICARSVEGFKCLQSSLPEAQVACSQRRSMILLYSKVCNVFLFMKMFLSFRSRNF